MQDQKAFDSVLQAMNPSGDPAYDKAIRSYYAEASFPEAYQEWSERDSAHFLAFNGLLAAGGGGVAGGIAFAPSVVTWGGDALAAYKTATAGYSVTAAFTSGAVTSGVLYTGSAAFAGGIAAARGTGDFQAVFDSKFSYGGLAGTMSIGGFTGVYGASMLKWAGIPSRLKSLLTPEGLVIQINRMAIGKAANVAAGAPADNGQKPREEK